MFFGFQALGYLYSSVSLSLIRPDNARAVLAAGCLLGGMDDLCQYAYKVCTRSITVDTIGGWLEFIDTIPPPSDGSIASDLPPTSVFGQYAQRLRDDVFHFLVVTLPNVLQVQHSPSDSPASPGASGRELLLQIFSRVPFEMFKAAMESPSFHFGMWPRLESVFILNVPNRTETDQARFRFAKEAIELRKRGIAGGPGAEETVVLAFGGSNLDGIPVHVTRKMRKRPLWKVNS
jgi:hypothetical protein